MRVFDNLLDFSSIIQQGNLSSLIAKYKDLVLPIMLLLIVGTLFIPLPAEAVSILILVNLAVSITVLVTSLFINSPVQLTAYPTILLLTTIFRLTLSVSVTRNILSHGEPGSVVEALGNITAQGNLITGAVLFIIILVVQYLVVSKGAERVAEVSARFTLDALPGKQMSIDADLRSGLIDQDQARAMRVELSKESQLHGALDGAMKFVKGDAICTVIIAFVNIIAGLSVGVLIHELSIPEATQKYTIATFGDGLAAIISSLLITLSAGIVVTRVSSSDEDSNIGADISSQLFASPRPLFITGGIMLLLTPLNLLFIPVGAAAAGIGYLLYRRQKQISETKEVIDSENSIVDQNEEIQMSFTIPISVGVSKNLSYLADKNNPKGSKFKSEILKLRNTLYNDLGVMVPFCYVGENFQLSPNEYFIAIKEVPVSSGMIRPDKVFVNDSSENIKVFRIEGENFTNPADLKPGAWIPSEQREFAEKAGLKVWDSEEVILLHLSRIMRQYAHEFIGIQESQGYLDFVARGMPKLVEETIGKVVSIHQFTEVLQKLVKEGISIRDTKSILDSLSEWGRTEKDPVVLAEHIRVSMRRYISYMYAMGSEYLFVYLLSADIEEMIRAAIRRNSTGSYLSLDPEISQGIIESIKREISQKPTTAHQPVIVTDIEIRRFVRKLLEIEFQNVAVLSYHELIPELFIQPIGRISLQNTGITRGFILGDNEFSDLPESLMPASMDELTN